MINYQLYLLQLENYEIVRFWRLLIKKGYFRPRVELRNKIVWTKKAYLIYLLSLTICAVIFVLLLNFANLIIAIIWVFLSFFVLPIIFTISLILISPTDFAAKKVVIGQARKIIKSAENLKIIGIAGSYGKTTMKNVLESVLNEKYKVLATPESVNTPVGIARWLKKNYSKETEVLIVEMGEHYRGDVRYLCSITPPDIAIVTGANEAHLERLKTLENTVSTIFEIVDFAKNNTLVMINADDQNLLSHYKKYQKNKNIAFYSFHEKKLEDMKIKDKRFDEKTLSWQFEFQDFGKLQIPVLGEYIIGDSICAILVAQSLSMSQEQIRRGLMRIKPIKHRLEPLLGAGDVLVIDDSYNANPVGVYEAIQTLKRFPKHRKLFITPGIVETGRENVHIHQKIGEQLAEVADKVLLIKNSATPYIASGLARKGFKKSDIMWFESAKQAHDSLGAILEKNDVILFQNDWGDQYI